MKPHVELLDEKIMAMIKCSECGRDISDTAVACVGCGAPITEVLMVPCIWYASKIAHPWERAMIGNMGAALRARGVGLSIYTDGGTTDFCLDGVLSWRALTLLERMRLILSSAGALWHLWGKAPRWWGLVRVRSRTVHTSWLPDPAWRGHPSRIFTEQADDGETVVKPTFESRLVHTEESAGVPPDGSRAVYVKLALASAPLREAIAALNCPVVDLGMGRVGASAAKSGCFISGDGPSEALHAAALTMQGSLDRRASCRERV